MRNPFAKVSDPNDFKTNPGSRYHVEYSVFLKDDGTLSFSESGKTDIQQMINAWFPLTDMHYIVSKLMAGDMSVINRNASKPIYGDFSRMPHSPIEVLNLVNGAKKVFYDLSVDERAKFDNDFNKWFASLEQASSVSEKVKEPVAENKETASNQTE